MCLTCLISTFTLCSPVFGFPGTAASLKAIHVSSHGQLFRGSSVGHKQNLDYHHWHELRRHGSQGISAAWSERDAEAVCGTWQRKDIQMFSLEPYLGNAGIDAESFVQEALRQCEIARGPMQNAKNYSGSWNDVTPSEDDIYILQNLTTWLNQQKASGKSQNKTWDQFKNSDHGPEIAMVVQHALTVPTPVNTTGTVRVLDFGCGSGEDLRKVKHLLNTGKKDSLCVDIFQVSSDDMTSIVLDPSSDAAYNTSLDKAALGNENTVHVAMSMVTFHHIPRHQMRKDALKFISRVLQPGGVFILAEWDNSVHPNRWIQFDLIHILNMMIFFGGAPASPDDLKIGTEYLSVHNWTQAVENAGLSYDPDRSLTNISGRMLKPTEVADLADPQRDFTAVFRKL